MDFIVVIIYLIPLIAAVITIGLLVRGSVRWILSKRGDPEVGRAALTAITIPHPPNSLGSNKRPVRWFLIRIENVGERVAYDIVWSWTPGEKAGRKPLSDRQYPRLNPGESFELTNAFAADMTDRAQLRLTLDWSDEMGKKHHSESWLMPSPHTNY